MPPDAYKGGLCFGSGGQEGDAGRILVVRMHGGGRELGGEGGQLEWGRVRGAWQLHGLVVGGTRVLPPCHLMDTPPSLGVCHRIHRCPKMS